MARVVIQEGGDGDRVVPLGESPVTLGRDGASDVLVEGDAVSPRHASLREEGARWYVKDEGSRYGTFVNDRRVTEQGLKHGDVIELGLGGPTLRFESEADAPDPEEEPITLEQEVPPHLRDSLEPITGVRPALPGLGSPRPEKGTGPPEPREDEERSGPARPDADTTVQLRTAPTPPARGMPRLRLLAGVVVLLALAVLWVRSCGTPVAGIERGAASSRVAPQPVAPEWPPPPPAPGPALGAPTTTGAGT